MEQLIVNKVGVTTYADGVTNIMDINSLTEGSIAWFDKVGTLIDDTVPVPTGGKVFLAVGRATGTGSHKTTLIDRGSTLKYNKRAYQAPVAQVSAIGYPVATATSMTLGLPGTLVAGTLMSVIIDEENRNTYDNTRRNVFDYTVQTGDTATTAVTALIAAINHATLGSDLATAAIVGAGLGITFTAKTAGVGFKLGVRDLLQDADITYGALREADNVNTGLAGIINEVFYSASTTITLEDVLKAAGGVVDSNCIANIVGSGTPAQALEMWYMATSEDGRTDTKQDGLNYSDINNPIESTATYTIYTIQWENKRINNPHNASLPDMETCIVLIPSANAATITDMDNILAAL